MINILEQTQEELNFFENLLSVKTKLEITFSDSECNLHTIASGTISKNINADYISFLTSDNKEVLLNEYHFGKNKNKKYFKYTLKK